MGKRRFMYRGVLIFVLLVTAFIYSQSENMVIKAEEAVVAEASPKKGVQVSQEALPFSLTTLKGKTVSLEDFRGKKVILNFFATWCYPCQEEMPIIVEMEKKLRQDGGVLLAINLTSEERDKGAGLPSFLTYYGASFDPLMDKNGQVLDLYKIFGIPTTILIDENGVIQKRINGQLSYGMMEELIK